MAGETVKVKTLVVEIVGDAAGLVKTYDEAKKQTEGFAGDLRTIGQSLSKTGQDLTLKVTAPLALMGGIALSTAATFDDSMRKVAAVTGATGAEFEALRQQAIDLGASTAWSASESAAAMQYLGMAGLDTNEILEATPQMLSLASAGAMDLAVAADIATNVISGFNLQVSDLAHISDALAYAASNSNTSVEQLGTAMAYVGPVASAAGRSIEETTGAIEIMSNAGIQGSMAGTALRGSLTALLTPTKQATDILATYGLTAADVDPQVHSLADIIDTLGAANLSTADTMTIFGDRAGPGMIALLQAGGDTLREYTADLEDCDGAAQRMAETMEGGAGGSLRELEGAVETLSITFGDLIADDLLPAIETTQGLANWLSNLDEGTQRTIVTVGLFAAAVGPATWAVGTLAGSLSSAISLYRTYQASTIAATIATRGFSAAIMANPIGLAIIGVTTLGAVLLPLIASTKEATDAQEDYNEAVGKMPDLAKKSTDELEEEIRKLRGKSDEIRTQIDLLRSQHTPAIQRNALATRQATQDTAWHRLAEGTLTDEFRNSTAAINGKTAALNKMTQAQKDAAIAAAEQALAENENERQLYETELALRALADGAETAYDQASKAVSDHQAKVSALQKEYDALKQTIADALGIDEEIDDTGRDVERADIRKIRAQQDLEEINKQIGEKERELRQGDYQSIKERTEAEEELEELRLRQREAVLDLADAEDRYSDALEDQAEAKAKKTDLETQLDGESIESAQTRLDEIGKKLEEETEKLNGALEAREKAQIAHETLMNQIENEALDTKSENWAKYVQWINNNPAIARTVHVEYDETGNPIGGLPEIPKIEIVVPTYATVAYEQVAPATLPGGEAESGGTPAAEAETDTLQAADASWGSGIQPVEQPAIQIVEIQVPRYSSPSYEQPVQSAPATAQSSGGAVPATSETAFASASEASRAVASGGVVIEGDLIVNSPAADAATMMATTRRTLRNLGTRGAVG